jgi:hypothetical protein
MCQKRFTGIKVYLDDVRPIPDGWVGARWPEEVIEYLKQGKVLELSLDHDLGDDERTGYDVLCWMEEEVAFGDFNPPKITIHTSNPPARHKMEQAVKSIKLLREQKLSMLKLD